MSDDSRYRICFIRKDDDEPNENGRQTVRILGVPLPLSEARTFATDFEIETGNETWIEELQ